MIAIILLNFMQTGSSIVDVCKLMCYCIYDSIGNGGVPWHRIDGIVGSIGNRGGVNPPVYRGPSQGLPGKTHPIFEV